MFALTESHRFLLYSQPTDMRKSFDALSGLIITAMNRNPLSGEVFIFVNKSKNLMKLLHFQQGGFVLYYKRLENGTFEIKFNKNYDNKIYVSYEELTMIIGGISVQNIQKRKRFSKSQNMF
jgi:transposase